MSPPQDQLLTHPIPFGSDENCTLDNCLVSWSILSYRPDLAANIVFCVYFALVGLVQIYLGVRWRSWGFMTGMILGCMTEVIGYVGRVIMYNDPFSYPGFLVQIICLTIGPVFYTASIYVTLYRAINFFGLDLARFSPKLLYCIFIPTDVVCLVLQATGGALSTETTGNSGVNISLAGLGLQVATLVLFSACFADYMIRYLRSGRQNGLGWRFAVFFGGLTAATLFILTRCAYRIAELRDGYSGSLFKDEGVFIALESVMVSLAAASLCVGHPGLVFSEKKAERSKETYAMMDRRNPSTSGDVEQL